MSHRQTQMIISVSLIWDNAHFSSSKTSQWTILRNEIILIKRWRFLLIFISTVEILPKLEQIFYVILISPKIYIQFKFLIVSHVFLILRKNFHSTDFTPWVSIAKFYDRKPWNQQLLLSAFVSKFGIVEVSEQVEILLFFIENAFFEKKFQSFSRKSWNNKK